MAFNRDPLIQKEIERIIKEFNIEYAVETGTYKGATTSFLANLVKKVYSVEITPNRFRETRKDLKSISNIELFLDSSPIFLEKLLPTLLPTLSTDKPILFYLDAHWHDYWPLLDELKVIGKYMNNKAIIVIDDFKVPNRSFAFDSYKDTINNFEYIEESLKSCYDSYVYYYNNRRTDYGKARHVGKIYIFPTQYNELVKKFYNTENNINYSNI